MTQLHIHRDHTLGLAAARKIALSWAEQVEAEFDMACTYEEGAKEDWVAFKRSGVTGKLHVTGTHFDLDAKLGFLLGAFKGRIEAEIVKNLDDLLASKASAKKPAAKSASAKSASAKK